MAEKCDSVLTFTFLVVLGILAKAAGENRRRSGTRVWKIKALQPGSLSCCSWCLRHAPRDLHQGRLKGPAHQVKWRARISLWIVNWLNSSKGGLCERTRTSDLSYGVDSALPAHPCQWSIQSHQSSRCFIRLLSGGFLDYGIYETWWCNQAIWNTQLEEEGKINPSNMPPFLLRFCLVFMLHPQAYLGLLNY